MGDEDVALMQRLKDGDDTALNDLMNRWQQPVANFIFRYVQNEQDAVELTQDTFIKVYQHRNRYEPKGKFSTWLFTIAANLSKNHLRWTKNTSKIFSFC